MESANVPVNEEISDQTLVDRVASGDQEAFATLYDRLSSQAYSLALYVVKDPGVAQDVVQEAFVNIWKMAGSYSRDRGTLSAWALTTVRNRAVDHLRRQRSRPQIVGDLENVVVATPHDEVWSEVAQGLDAEKVRAAMLTLSAEQRETIELGFFKGLSHQEIADRTGSPLGTVKSRMRNGMIKLRVELTGQTREEFK